MDPRFHRLAAGAFDRAARIFAIGPEMRRRILDVFGAQGGLESRLSNLDLGVDTEAFAPVERTDRGAVAGGRVIADWPGLAAASLHEGRDLKPTLSTRRLCKAVLRDHLGLREDRVDGAVFPGTGDLPALGGLFNGG